MEEKILDETLGHLSHINRFETPIYIAAPVLSKFIGYGDKVNLNTIELALKKLVKDGYCIHEKRTANTFQGWAKDQDCYMISFEGLFFYQKGGYKFQREKDRADYLDSKNDKRQIRFLNSVLALGTGIAALYYLIEILKLFGLILIEK